MRVALAGLLVAAVLAGLASPALAVEGPSAGPSVGSLRVELILFGLTLLGVALFHKHTLQVALAGLASIVALKLGFTTYPLGDHVVHEGPTLLNLLGLLLGFALLAKHFEDTRLPDLLPRFLPDDWKGGLVLLVIVCVLSSFLDNIAAAMIGGTIARVVFQGRVHVGYLAAIVAASNAGGAGSVVGDTTTTMMWIDPVRQVSPLEVVDAFVGTAAALAVFGVVAARQQHAHQPIQRDAPAGVTIDWVRLGIVALILAGAIAANVAVQFPAAGVWAALLLGALVRKTAWHELRSALKGSAFLLSLVLCASMMPVDELPPASWPTAFGLGFVSAVFDNIPLTKLALVQGGYDWGFLAFAVGFGGSMVWFGSSAGVALSNQYPEAKSVASWLRHGWHVAVAYVVGFFAMLLVLDWHPHAGAAPGAGASTAPVGSTAPVTTGP